MRPEWTTRMVLHGAHTSPEPPPLYLLDGARTQVIDMSAPVAIFFGDPSTRRRTFSEYRP